MNDDLKPAADFIESIKPLTLEQKFAKERALEALGRYGGLIDLEPDPEPDKEPETYGLTPEQIAEDESAKEAYLQFKNLEEVREAIDAGLLSSEVALILERVTKNRVTYIEYLEDRIGDSIKEEGEG